MRSIRRSRALAVALTVAAAAAAAAAPAASAATNAPDPTGRVVTGFDLRHISGEQKIGGIAAVPGGDIVAAGTSGRANTLTLTRYTPSGTLDRSFGTDGTVKFDTPAITEVNALLPRPDGSFVVVAVNSPDEPPLLVGVTPQGSLERSFGGGIVVTPTFQLTCPRCHSAALDSAGRVLLAGSRGGRDSVIARVTTSGQLDPTFGVGGFAGVAGVGVNTLDVVVAEPGGDLFALAADGPDTAMVRLSPAGIRRASYGSGGAVTIPGSRPDDILALGMGRVLVLAQRPERVLPFGPGQGHILPGRYPAVARRYLPDGSLDATYGAAGAAQVGSIDEEFDPLFSPRLLSTSTGGVDVVSDYELGGANVARLGANGAVLQPLEPLAAGFGAGQFESDFVGKVQVTFPNKPVTGDYSFRVAAAAARPNGTLVLGGDASISVQHDEGVYSTAGTWGLEALRADLSPDPSFGSLGAVDARARLRHGSLRKAATSGVPIEVSMADRGEIELRIYARSHGRRIVVADRTAVFLEATAANIRVRATTARGRAFLRHAHRGGLTLYARATVVGGESRSLHHTTLTLRAPR